jgi:hypothetical protein
VKTVESCQEGELSSLLSTSLHHQHQDEKFQVCSSVTWSVRREQGASVIDIGHMTIQNSNSWSELEEMPSLGVIQRSGF